VLVIDVKGDSRLGASARPTSARSIALRFPGLSLRSRYPSASKSGA
jgi:hypothetical protein